jgi:transcriptional regulator with XRE-family HTH domain
MVKRLREQMHLTQKALAEKSGLSSSLISKLERDDKKTLTAIRTSTLDLLADGLGLSKDSPDRQLLIDVAFEGKQQSEQTRTSVPDSLMEPIKRLGDKPQGTVPPTSKYDLSERQEYTRMEDVANCVLSMLQKARELSEKGAGEVCVTTQGASSIFLHLGWEDRWHQAIDEVMRRKWSVVSLYRLTGDMKRAFEVIQEIRTLSVYPEQYIPRCFRQIGSLRPTYNLLIVPQVGTLWALSTHNPDVVDAAFFYPDNEKYKLYTLSFSNHFNLLFTETVQLARTYKPRSPEWDDTLAATSQREGAEFVANDCLDTLSMPPALYDELLEKSLAIANARSSMAFRRRKTHHIQSREAFERHVQTFEYRTIMPKKSFENALGLSNDALGKCRYPVDYLPKTQYPPNLNQTHDINKYIVVDESLAIAHIKRLIDDLRRYNNFEIALIPIRHPYEKYVALTPWFVKGETSVLTAIYRENKKDINQLELASLLEITDTSIVRSYRQHFLDIWEEIADQDKLKQKENVIRELEGTIEQAGKSKTED